MSKIEDTVRQATAEQAALLPGGRADLAARIDAALAIAREVGPAHSKRELGLAIDRMARALAEGLEFPGMRDGDQDPRAGWTEAERAMFADADPERPFFPDAKVQLTGTSGNPAAIIVKVRRALRSRGATGEQVKAFTAAATSGDYGNVIQTAMRWADVS